MTNLEIYKLASELTEKQVENILYWWNQNNKKSLIDTFNTLVRLGDSKELALATTIAENQKESNYNEYFKAYCI